MLVELTARFKKQFGEAKREKNILDFTDMEHFALQILMTKEGEEIHMSQAARELSAKYDEVLVDEYQDSNLVQELLTTAVSPLAPGAASEPEPSQDAATYEDQYVGVWRTVEVASNGQAFTIEEFEEIAGEELTKQATLTITLNEDGSCEVLNGAGIGGAGIWTASDGEIVIRDAASTFYLTDQGDGSLLLVQENSSHTFRR